MRAGIATRLRKQRRAFLHICSEFREFVGECTHSPAKRNIAHHAHVALPQGVLAFPRGCVAMHTQTPQSPQKLGSFCATATGCDRVLARVRCNAHTAPQSPTAFIALPQVYLRFGAGALKCKHSPPNYHKTRVYYVALSEDLTSYEKKNPRRITFLSTTCLAT